MTNGTSKSRSRSLPSADDTRLAQRTADILSRYIKSFETHRSIIFALDHGSRMLHRLFVDAHDRANRALKLLRWILASSPSNSTYDLEAFEREYDIPPDIAPKFSTCPHAPVADLIVTLQAAILGLQAAMDVYGELSRPSPSQEQRVHSAYEAYTVGATITQQECDCIASDDLEVPDRFWDAMYGLTALSVCRNNVQLAAPSDNV